MLDGSPFLPTWLLVYGTESIYFPITYLIKWSIYIQTASTTPCLVLAVILSTIQVDISEGEGGRYWAFKVKNWTFGVLWYIFVHGEKVLIKIEWERVKTRRSSFWILKSNYESIFSVDIAEIRGNSNSYANCIRYSDLDVKSPFIFTKSILEFDPWSQLSYGYSR